MDGLNGSRHIQTRKRKKEMDNTRNNTSSNNNNIQTHNRNNNIQPSNVANSIPTTKRTNNTRNIHKKRKTTLVKRMELEKALKKIDQYCKKNPMIGAGIFLFSAVYAILIMAYPTIGFMALAIIGGIYGITRKVKLHEIMIFIAGMIGIITMLTYQAETTGEMFGILGSLFLFPAYIGICIYHLSQREIKE